MRGDRRSRADAPVGASAPVRLPDGPRLLRPRPGRNEHDRVIGPFAEVVQRYRGDEAALGMLMRYSVIVLDPGHASRQDHENG